MPKKLKKKISKNTKFILSKIVGKLLVQCPNCLTKFFRTAATTERCSICEKEVTYEIIKK